MTEATHFPAGNKHKATQICSYTQGIAGENWGEKKNDEKQQKVAKKKKYYNKCAGTLLFLNQQNKYVRCKH